MKRTALAVLSLVALAHAGNNNQGSTTAAGAGILSGIGAGLAAGPNGLAAGLGAGLGLGAGSITIPNSSGSNNGGSCSGNGCNSSSSQGGSNSNNGGTTLAGLGALSGIGAGLAAGPNGLAAGLGAGLGAGAGVIDLSGSSGNSGGNSNGNNNGDTTLAGLGGLVGLGGGIAAGKDGIAIGVGAGAAVGGGIITTDDDKEKCKGDFVYRNGRCQCPSGQVEVPGQNYKCQDSEECLGDFVFRDGICQCPAGEVVVIGIPNTCRPECGVNEIYDDVVGACVCPLPFTQSLADPTCSCNAPFTQVGEACTCTNGFEVNAAQDDCVCNGSIDDADCLPCESVIADSIFDPITSQCVCGQNRILSVLGDACICDELAGYFPGLDGQCVFCDTTLGFVFDLLTGTCGCPTGTGEFPVLGVPTCVLCDLIAGSSYSPTDGTCVCDIVGEVISEDPVGGLLGCLCAPGSGIFPEIGVDQVCVLCSEVLGAVISGTSCICPVPTVYNPLTNACEDIIPVSTLAAERAHTTMQVPSAPQLFDPATGQPLAAPTPAVPTTLTAPAAPAVPSAPAAPAAPAAPIVPGTPGTCATGFQQCTINEPEGQATYCYNPDVYACVTVANGNLICPAAANAACGNGCYDPTQFKCDNGVVIAN